MNIQKFKHACLVISKDNQSLVVDPGEWSDDYVVPSRVVGVIITHEHGDHFSPEHIAETLRANPDAKVYALDSIVAQMPVGTAAQAVTAGETIDIGSFHVRFTGGQHATIHPDYPVCVNLGVVVDDGELYYPGDSFVLPDCPVNTLAVPASAPWLKIGEAIDFIAAVKPQKFFATHDAMLSDTGRAVTDAWLTKAATATNATLTPSEFVVTIYS